MKIGTIRVHGCLGEVTVTPTMTPNMGAGSNRMMGGSGSLTASQVRQEQQGLQGTVSSYTANGAKATFTLTLPTDSAFATLTGATTVQVYQQVGTQLRPHRHRQRQ